MIKGKIILKSATKLTLDKRFSEIAQHAPPAPTPRIQQQANVIIPRSGQELFGNRRPAGVSLAARLKKRSINFRLGLGPTGNAMLPYTPRPRPRVFQRIGIPNRRRGGMRGGGASSYVFGGQSGMGIRLQGQGRVGNTRTFRSRTRGYLNNNAVSRVDSNRKRGNQFRPNRGRRMFGNRNFNRQNRGRGGPNNNRGRGNRGRNNGANQNATKESLDNDLDAYMAKTKIENDTNEMDAI